MSGIELAWRVSSHSGGNGSCVEVAAWRKSSYSGGNGSCVEVGAGERMYVRDTKDRGGPALDFPMASWSSFIDQVKSGNLAR